MRLKDPNTTPPAIFFCSAKNCFAIFKERGLLFTATRMKRRFTTYCRQVEQVEILSPSILILGLPFFNLPFSHIRFVEIASLRQDQ